MALSRLANLAREREDLSMRVALAVAQLAALLWFAIPVGLPLDDAWIHQVVARTFAESGTLGYAPGQHGAAATSYLWAALLAVNFKTVNVSPVWWTFGLCAASSVVTGQALLAMLTRRGTKSAEAEVRARRRVMFVATLLAVTSGNVLWYAHSGMEASLFVALSCVAIWATTAQGSVRVAVVGGVAAGLVVLTRPEAAPLCGVLLLYVIARRRGLARILALGGPALLAGVVYVGSNLAKTGHASPATLSGRRWLWFEPGAGLSSFDRAADFADAWVERLSTYTFDTGAVPAWIMIALAAYGALRLLREKNDALRILFGWAALHTASYLVMLPTPGHGGRYQPFVPLLYVTCIAIGTAFIVRDALRRVPAAKWIALAAIVPWFAFSIGTTTTLRRAHALAVAHIEATELATGRFVDTLPPGVIASFDIGGIGWTTRRPILDAGGLSDPKTAALLERGRLWEWLEKNDVRYLVLPESWEHVLPVVDRFRARLHLESPALRLTELHEVETPFERWLPSIASTWNAAPKQVVYRVDYTGAPGPEDVALPSPSARREVRDDLHLVRERERHFAEYSLAMLASWGAALDVQITPLPSKPSPDAAPCAIHLGLWGAATAGCDAIAEAGLLRSVLYEDLGRYLDVGDLRGALTALPQAIVTAKRLTDPRFLPPLPPIMPPLGTPRDHTVGWGLPLAALIVALVVLLERGLLGRLIRKKKEGDDGDDAPLAASAAAVSLFVVITFGAAAGGCKSESVLDATARGRGAVELALASGAPIDARGGGGQTALIEAAARGDLDLVAFLLAHGASPTAHDRDDATALHHAARGGHHACALVLARAGAPIDAVAGPRRRTALEDAATSGSIETLRVLLDSGSDAAHADAFGETALHLLARADAARVTGMATLLLQRSEGKQLLTRYDLRGFAPAHAAAASDSVAVLREISGPEVSSLRHEHPADTAARYGRDRAADYLIRSGEKLADARAWPPLHEAARMDDVPRAAVLLANGADPAFDYNGKSALDVAREQHQKRVMTLLTRPIALPLP